MSGDKNYSGTNTSVYTSSGTSLYDKHCSAIEFKFVNNNGLLKFSPINAEFIGRDPKKGDKVYSYDEASNLLVTALDAKRLLTALSVEENSEEDEYSQIIIDTESAMFTRKITIHKPNTIKLTTMKTKHDSYIIQVSQEHEKDGKMVLFHCFQASSFSLKNVKTKEVEVYTDHTEFELFKDWLRAIIDVSVGGNKHSVNCLTSKMSSGNRAGNNNRSRNVPQIEGEEDDSDDVKQSKTALDAENEFGG